MPCTVRQLARMSGVSVRTLHHYDQTGLLRPAARSDAGYRLYGEPELLRLQQILFYRALDVPLKDIAALLQASDLDTLEALGAHRRSLLERQKSLSALLETVDNTIARLQGVRPMPDKDLYAGFPPEVREWRTEAIEKYGEATIQQSERALGAMQTADLQDRLQALHSVTQALASCASLAPDAARVQNLVAQHYDVIRQLWGTHSMADPQADAYAGLGQLYVDDARFLSHNGMPRPLFARFLRDAMAVYSESLRPRR
jgi:DNA-binding transcriptional MerR regulator